ncbi:hypothetical protein O988_04022 [Pseudogymnoascus sp. VKM F-3808]|nr:hypothetical protein O988_04022 [Pseudogymnoascus sp. VKM F-3808]
MQILVTVKLRLQCSSIVAQIVRLVAICAQIGRGADTTIHGGRWNIDGVGWRLDPGDWLDAPDGLYSDGLIQLAMELDKKYELDHISSISYILAVNLNCVDADDPEQKSAVCLLADRNMVERVILSLGLRPAYGSFTSPGRPGFSKIMSFSKLAQT